MRTIILFIFLILTFQVSSQTLDYFESNPQWRQSSGCGNQTACVEEEEYVYYINGDSTVNNLLYNKVFRHGIYALNWYDSPPIPSWCDTSMSYNIFFTLIRQEQERMYILHENEPEELLYDFNLEVADTLPLTWNQWSEEIIVTSIDSIQVGDDYRRIFNLNNQYPLMLIEGIGHDGGFLELFQPSLDCGSELICFTLNDTTYYPNYGVPCDLTVNLHPIISQGKIKYYPNPVKDYLTIEHDFRENIEKVVVYNTSGQNTVLMFNKIGEDKTNIDLSILEKGLYIIEIVGKGKTILNLKVMKD